MPEASLGFEGTSSDLEKIKSYMCTRRTSSAMPIKPSLDLYDFHERGIALAAPSTRLREAGLSASDAHLQYSK